MGKTSYQALSLLSISILAGTGILLYWDSQIFQRFLGGLPPLTAILGSIVLGFILLSFLLSKGWFSIYKQGNFKKLLRISGLAVLFSTTSILVDLQVPFSADINILFPKSLLFYPVIGFFVEILFHVLPISILLFSLTSIFRQLSTEKIIWTSIFLVALLEPTYQVQFMDTFPLWAVIVIWINLFLFNIFQLLIFKQYDFIAMYSFRIVYYLIWHVIWGYFRGVLI